MNCNMIVKFLLVSATALLLSVSAFAQTTTDAEPTIFDWFNIPQTNDVQTSPSLVDQLHETIQNLPDMLTTYELEHNSTADADLIGPSLADDTQVDVNWFSDIMDRLRNWHSMSQETSDVYELVPRESWYPQDLLVD